MADDFVIRCPHHRKIVEQIISGKLKKLGHFGEARVYDFLEFYSARPWLEGSDIVQPDAEPNALRVIIRVSKFEIGERPTPNFIYWEGATEKVAPDPERGFEENKLKILRALNDIGASSGISTPAEILSEATGISLQEVQDHLELLDQEGKVKHVVTSGGGSAFMQPRGRFELKEAAMAKKPSSPTSQLDILLTWSGTASHEIASFFHGWLPSVLPGIQPWISDEDIAKGKKWFPELMGQLSKTNISITFITPENVRSPWIYYEVGVIAAKMDEGIICAYLTGVDHTHVKDTPLGQFQWTESNKGDTWKLIRSINRQLEDKVHNSQLLEGNFSTQWAKLKRQIDRVVEDLSPVKEDVVEVEPPIEQQLSEEARHLLAESSQNSRGRILQDDDSDGYELSTGEVNLITDQSPRGVATWKAALQELIDFGLVKDMGYEGRMFEVTKNGFDVADLINSRS